MTCALSSYWSVLCLTTFWLGWLGHLSGAKRDFMNAYCVCIHELQQKGWESRCSDSYLPEVPSHCFISDAALIIITALFKLYYFTCTEQYHELSRHVLHECYRHESNAALTASDISCTCEIIDLSYVHA